MRNFLKISYLVLLVLVAWSCRKDPDGVMSEATPYDLEIPQGFPQMIIPQDNPLTVEGVELGRRLFYDERLSGDNTMSCASCHMPEFGFSDTAEVSVGIDGIAGTRNAMPLFNIGWANNFFWDGRDATLEEQILEPVPNPIEMHQEWKDASSKIAADPLYPEMFKTAFGNYKIDSTQIAKAIAQFIRTLISADSKFDKYLRGEVVLTPDEFAGLNLFNDLQGGDCFHCHGNTVFFTDFSFANNGLDLTFSDLGRETVTGNPDDRAAFKVPSLRNLSFTAPYMHDGRFETIDEVIDFYNSGVQDGPYTDPLMEFAHQGGTNLTATEKAQLKAFILTLNDTSFTTNPAFQDPGY